MGLHKNSKYSHITRAVLVLNLLTQLQDGARKDNADNSRLLPEPAAGSHLRCTTTDLKKHCMETV